MSKWMDNAISLEGGKGEPEHFLLDLGYVNAKETRKHADQLKAMGIGKRNFEIAGFGRLLCKIPKTKMVKIIHSFPNIHNGPGYAWTTHHWLEGDSGNFEFAWGRSHPKST